MKAFGQIIKSLFILRYLDELANRFTRAVAAGSPREYTKAEKEEQEIAESDWFVEGGLYPWGKLGFRNVF